MAKLDSIIDKWREIGIQIGLAKGKANGLRAAAREARRQASQAYELDHRHYSDAEMETSALAVSEVARWCDRRASKLERGK